MAKELGGLFKTRDQIEVNYLVDIYHTVTNPVISQSSDNVSLLKQDDKEESTIIASEFEINGFKNIDDLVSNGFLAYVKVSDEIVSITYTPAVSPKYADIGTFTKELYCGKGYSSATASLIVNQVLSKGLIPVWSCGKNNIGSLKVAQKLGFKEVSRRNYVIMPWRKKLTTAI